MKKKLFPPEVIQFTAEHHFIKYSSSLQIIYLTSLLAIVLFIISSFFIRIDITTQCRGIVRNPNENNQLQSMVYGEVIQSYLAENKQVKQGDTLLRLRTDKLDEQLLAEKRKRQENLSFVADINRLIQGARPLGYKYSGEFNEWITRKEELKTQVDYYEREWRRAEALYKKNVLSESDFLLEKNHYEAALRQMNLALNEYRNRWQTEKKRLELENIDIASQIVLLNKEKRNYLIVAPMGGSVMQTQSLRPGNFVTPGQIIAHLSQDEDLIAECYVKPSDIGFVKVGGRVTFQFDAFNFREWGTINGEVKEISNDIFQNDDQEPVFRVRCLMSPKYLMLRNGCRGNIRKGMMLTGQFYLTNRSLAQLLFDKVDDWVNPKISKP